MQLKLKYSMDIAKKLNKIIDDFYAVYDKYQKAIKKNDRKAIIKYGKELANFLGEHRQILEISEDYVNELKKALDSLEETFIKASRKKNQDESLYMITQAEKQAYFQALLKQLRVGKNHSGH